MEDETKVSTEEVSTGTVIEEQPKEVTLYI